MADKKSLKKVLMPVAPPKELSPAGDFDDVLFDFCRADDYRGIYREFVKRFGKPEKEKEDG